MDRVRLLQFNGVTPYIVFDGGPLPMKAGTEGERDAYARIRTTQLTDQEEEGKVGEGKGISATRTTRKSNGMFSIRCRRDARDGLGVDQGVVIFDCLAYPRRYEKPEYAMLLRPTKPMRSWHFWSDAESWTE
jgi:hypothetical protein